MTDSPRLVAFELTAAAAKDFAGGSVAVGDGGMIDLGEAFEKGSKIVVDADSIAVDALDAHPALKRTKATGKITHEIEPDVSEQPDPAAEESDESPASEASDPDPEPETASAGSSD